MKAVSLRFARALAAALAFSRFARSAEESLRSPDGRIGVVVDDTDGIRYRVTVDDQPALAPSRLGLDLEGGISLGRRARIEGATRTGKDGSYENRFGQRRTVRDHYREMRLALRERADAPGRLNMIVRAYDNGLAPRYEIPVQPGLESYVVTDELTEFAFPSDAPCWAGDYSDCAECQYPEKRLSQLMSDLSRPQVLPLLVKLPHGFAAVAESDLLDWSGMFVTAAGRGALLGDPIAHWRPPSALRCPAVGPERLSPHPDIPLA